MEGNILSQSLRGSARFCRHRKKKDSLVRLGLQSTAKSAAENDKMSCPLLTAEEALTKRLVQLRYTSAGRHGGLGAAMQARQTAKVMPKIGREKDGKDEAEKSLALFCKYLKAMLIFKDQGMVAVEIRSVSVFSRSPAVELVISIPTSRHAFLLYPHL